MKKSLLLLILVYCHSISAQRLPVLNLIKYDTTDLKGYYFFTASSNLIITDKETNIIFYKPWNFDYTFTLAPNKEMFLGTNDFAYLLDSTFKIIDSFVCKKGVKNDPHDALALPEGHILLLGTENVKMVFSDLPDFKERWKSDTAFIPTAVIQEQDAQHNVVFEWHAKDHFLLSDADSFFDNRDNPPEWTHSNALALDKDDNILLSSRNLNEITKINRNNGFIMWRFGGKHNEFKFVNCPVPFYGQHDIKRLTNGHITLFDNGQNSVSHGARAMEFELDEKNKIATLVWSYTYDKNSSSNGRGNVQRLSDGNTLISYGKHFSGDVCFLIVNSSGKKLMQVNGPSVYRVTNYQDLPFQLHRPVINCFDSAGVKYFDAGAGYKSYKWNTGDTTRIIKITNQGSYSVFVPYGDGGFISSEKYRMEDIYKPCESGSSPRNKKE